MSGVLDSNGHHSHPTMTSLRVGLWSVRRHPRSRRHKLFHLGACFSLRTGTDAVTSAVPKTHTRIMSVARILGATTTSATIAPGTVHHVTTPVKVVAIETRGPSEAGKSMYRDDHPSPAQVVSNSEYPVGQRSKLQRVTAFIQDVVVLTANHKMGDIMLIGIKQ